MHMNWTSVCYWQLSGMLNKRIVLAKKHNLASYTCVHKTQLNGHILPRSLFITVSKLDDMEL